VELLVAHAADEARSALVACLAQMDLTIVETADGERARAILSRDNAPAVALLDWDLPGVTGLDVCRLLREAGDGRPPYVIVVAPAAHARDVAEAAYAGADDFVWTPVGGDDLRARVAFARTVVEARPWTTADGGGERSLRGVDPATPSDDRTRLVARLEQELARSRRERETLGVGILDVDGLSPVNREFGRDAGDEVLREVARRLKETLRPYDVFGRLESDEFLIVTPNTGEYDLSDALNRVREAMVTRPFCYSDRCLDITVTMGGVTGSDETAEQLIAMARPVLDEAKESGGDRVVAGARVELESVIHSDWLR
jgi:two-component system, cell cycle response regulator